MVPGNHDLNWELSRKKGYELIDRDELPEKTNENMLISVSEDVVRVRDEAGYQERFAHFKKFFQEITNETYHDDYSSQFTLNHLPELNLLVLGLNSAWELDHHYKARASIHPNALTYALEAIRSDVTYNECHKFAVWHHPLNNPTPDRITDHGFMERLAQAGFSVVFHGHLHKADTGQYSYDMNPAGRKINIIGAGTFGAPVREWQPGYPLQYNLLKINQDILTVETRCRREINGSWKPDAIWLQGAGKDPLPRYGIKLPKVQRDKKTKSTPKTHSHQSAPLLLPKTYKDWLIERCRNMDIDRLRERGKVIQVNLPELFIPLYSHPLETDKKHNASLDAVKLMSKEEKRTDIEELILESPYLLINGQAGSGKTTLIRNFCYTILTQDDNKNNVLPVLVFLKDMRWLEIEKYTAGAQTAEKILNFYFQHTQNGLHLDTVLNYCQAQKAIFLFDGLDEIDRKRRDLISDSFADFAHGHPGCKIIFTGRPHGLEGTIIDRFGDRLAEILPLTMPQIELFVNKWFCTVMEGNNTACRKTAHGMISEMKAHPAIEVLKDTPLMLTAICLLYLDGKELPEQRAELYKKFIEYLTGCKPILLHFKFYRSLLSFQPGLHSKFALSCWP